MAYQAEIEKLEGRFREKPEQWFAALADAYRKSGDVDMALEVLNAWIDKRPSYTSGHIVLGRCHLDKQQDAVAAEAFEKVLELDMENVIALKSLSEIAERKGDAAGARRWLQRLLEVDPMNEEATEALERLGEGVSVGAEGTEEVEPAGEPSGFADASDQPREQPMPAIGFEATELESPAEFDAESIAGFEPTGKVTEEPISAPIDDSAMLQADAILEEVEAGADEVSVFEVTRVSDVEPPAAEEPKAPSIPDTVPEGMEAISIEPDTDSAAVVSDEVGDLEPQTPPAVDDTLTDESALVLGPALEALEREVAEEAAGAAAEGTEETEAAVPEEAGFAFGMEHEAEELSGDAPSDVPLGPRTDELAFEAVEGIGSRPSEAVPVEFVEPGEEEPAPEIPAVDEAPVKAEDIESLPLIVPESVPAAEPEADQRRAPEPEPVITETMAQLYTSQGLYEDAAAVYRRLLVQRPDDPHLLAKLEELERVPARTPQQVSGGVTAPPSGQTVRAMLEEVIAGIRTTETPQTPETAGVDPVAAAENSSIPSESSSLSSEPPGSSESLSPSDFSFDDFFGSGGEPAPNPEAAEPPAEPEGPQGAASEDFKDWLKGLKT